MQILSKTCRLAIAVSLASALVVTEGSASRPGVSAGPSGETSSFQGRRCVPAPAPKTLPDIATIVDADTLRRAIAAELAGSSTTGAMRFSIRFDEDGQTEWVERIANEASDEPLQPRVQRLIAAHLKTQASAREPWSLRLEVISGDSVQFRLGRSEVCPVERIADNRYIGSRTELMQASDVADLRRSGPYTVHVEVSATGTVLSANLIRRSGSRIVDDGVLKTAREARYRPALVDGIPVAGRYELSSSVRMR